MVSIGNDNIDLVRKILERGFQIDIQFSEVGNEWESLWKSEDPTVYNTLISSGLQQSPRSSSEPSVEGFRRNSDSITSYNFIPVSILESDDHTVPINIDSSMERPDQKILVKCISYTSIKADPLRIYGTIKPLDEFMLWASQVHVTVRGIRYLKEDIKVYPYDWYDCFEVDKDDRIMQVSKEVASIKKEIYIAKQALLNKSREISNDKVAHSRAEKPPGLWPQDLIKAGDQSVVSEPPVEGFRRNSEPSDRTPKNLELRRYEDILILQTTLNRLDETQPKS